MSFVSKLTTLGAAGSGGDSYWILQGYYPVTSRFINPRDIAVDSSDNVYVVGLTRNAVGSTGGMVAKFDTEGTNQYFKTFYGTGSPSTVRNFRCKMDSNDNLYVTGNGYYLVSGSTGQDLHLTKINTSTGAISWTRDIAYTYQNNITEFYNDLYYGNIDIDPTTNYPSVSYNTYDSNRGPNAHIAEWTDTGTLNNTVLLNYGGDSVYISGAFKRSGDWHAVLNKNEGDWVCIMAQLDSTNIYLPNYRRKLSKPSSNIYIYDSNGSGNELFLCGSLYTGGQYYSFIQSQTPSAGYFNTRESISSSTYGGKHEDFRRVWYDSVNGNVWAITGSGGSDCDIVKFNTSLAMQGRYTISGSNLEKFYKSICTDSAGNVYVSFQDGGTVDGMALFKLPPDLSVSGTYNGMTITNSTTDITSGTVSVSIAATTALSVSGDTTSDGTETFTETAGSWTEDTLSNL